MKTLLQAEAAECGLACLAMVAGFHGQAMDLATLRRRLQVSLKGATLRQLIGEVDRDRRGGAAPPTRL